MKTIIHLTLTDEDRSDLAKRIHRNPATKHLVTRHEVTELVLDYIQQEIKDAYDEPVQEREASEPAAHVTREKFAELIDETQRNSESSLIPDWSALESACTRVLAHIDENKATNTINVGWCVSVIAATGAI